MRGEPPLTHLSCPQHIMDAEMPPADGSAPPQDAPALSDTDAALQELFSLVEALEAEPGNIPLLTRHLEVARRAGQGMEEQVQRGLELLLEVRAGGEGGPSRTRVQEEQEQ